MAHLVWWYTIGVIIACILIGAALDYSTSHMSGAIRKFVIIFSIFAVIGICASPVEDTNRLKSLEPA